MATGEGTRLPDFPAASGFTDGDFIFMTQDSATVKGTVAQLKTAVSVNRTTESFTPGDGVTPGTFLPGGASITLAGTYGSVDNLDVYADGAPQLDSTLVGNVLGFPNGGVPNVGLITVKGVVARSIGTPADGSVTARSLAAGAVTALSLSAGAVTAPAIATGAVSAKLANEAITQLATGFFFSGNGSRIHRFNDRILVGDATANDGAFPNGQQDWLSQYQSYFAGGGPMTTTVMSVLSGGPGSALIGEAILGGASTARGTSTGTNAIGIQGYAVANNSHGGDFGWAFYGESHRAAATASSCYGMEICIVNRGNVVGTDPYHGVAGGTYGIQIDSGCGFSSAQMPGLTSASVGLQFVDNSADGVAPFVKGIVFGSAAISGTNGITGQGTAIAMARGHVVQWYGPSGGNGGSIVSFVTNASDATQIAFGDSGSGLIVNSSNSKALLGIPNVANAANYVQIDANVSSGHVGVTAEGSDAVIHLHLLPKSTGSVMIGGQTASSATGGSASALPAAPVEYLDILTAAGNSRKIPLYAN